jgi:hypothetical protein
MQTNSTLHSVQLYNRQMVPVSTFVEKEDGGYMGSVSKIERSVVDSLN